MDSVVGVISSIYADAELKHVISVLDKNTSKDLVHNGQRIIRTKAETNIMRRATSILDQMRPLAQNLESLGEHVQNSRKTYTEMYTAIEKCAAASSVFVENADYLRQEAASLESQASTLEAFMKAVYISPHEREVLMDNGNELTPEFFDVLSRLKGIQSQAALLLLAEAPIKGEVLMQETSKLLDQAYARIKLAIDAELRQKNHGAVDETPRFNLRMNMALLADRPLLFKAVLQEQSGIRREMANKELRNFISIEQPNASAVPVRYVGSVLAWMHAAIINEFEHISLLLDPELHSDEDESASGRTLEHLLATSDIREVIAELVDTVISSLEQTLRDQINAVLLSQTSAATVGELESVILFYKNLLSKYNLPTVGRMLSQWASNADHQFDHLLEVSYRGWDSRVDVALSVLKIQEEGIYSDADYTRGKLDAILDNSLKEELDKATPMNSLNVLDVAITRLAGFVSAQYKLDVYRKLQSDFEAEQVAIEVREMKIKSNLLSLQSGSISTREFLTSFDEFLSNASFDLQARLENISSPTLQNRIASSAVLEFMSEYEFAVKDIPNARSPDDVRCLLL